MKKFVFLFLTVCCFWARGMTEPVRAEGPEKSPAELQAAAADILEIVESGNLEALKKIEAPAVNWNAADENGNTLLHYAVARGDQPMVDYLIEKGADVKARNRSGETPLHQVHISNSPEAARALIRAGADVNAVDDEFRMTPLFWNLKPVAEILIQAGADIHARSATGLTPVAWLAYGNAHEAVEYLLSKGADVNAVNQDGKTPLHIAANWGHVETARVLIRHGADLNARDESGWTPLSWAYFEGGPEIVEFLLKQGAKPLSDKEMARIPGPDLGQGE